MSSDFLTVVLLLTLLIEGFVTGSSGLDDERPLPNVAVVWLEYPESLNSSRMALRPAGSAFDLFAVVFAVDAV